MLSPLATNHAFIVSIALPVLSKSNQRCPSPISSNRLSKAIASLMADWVVAVVADKPALVLIVLNRAVPAASETGCLTDLFAHKR